MRDILFWIGDFGFWIWSGGKDRKEMTLDRGAKRA
jgi:hypothetical protein